MEEKKQEVNWDEEVKGLKVSSDNYFKPKQGITQIVFLDNGTPLKGKDYNKKDCEKIQFKISNDKKIQIWEVFRAYPGTQPSKNGLYGQIAQFASKKGGLTGQAIYLNTVGTGKETKYSIIDPVTFPQPGEGE